MLLAAHVAPLHVAGVALVALDAHEGKEEQLHLRHMPGQGKLSRPL